MAVSCEYDKAKKLTDVTGVDFEELMLGISNRYLSEPQLVSEIANGETDGVLEFDFNGHSRADR